MITYVKEVQTWLAQEFPDYFKYDETGSTSGLYPLIADGIAGQSTIKALTMALQLTLNVSKVTGIWDEATAAACPTVDAEASTVIIKLVQGCLYCKGYYDHALNGSFSAGTILGIKNFKTDLGLSMFSNVIEPQFFRSLLTLDQVKETSDTDPYIRAAQQYLNVNYYDAFGPTLSFVPTDGIYEAKTNRALIMALQTELTSGFVEYLKSLPPEENGKTLYEEILPYIAEIAASVTDSNGGVLELPKLASVIEAYFANKSPVPEFWSGWGTDLAAGMLATTLSLPMGFEYAQAFPAAFSKIGDIGGPCRYANLCSDLDAIKITEILKSGAENPDNIATAFTDALDTYYAGLVNNRFKNIIADIPTGLTYDELYTAIYNRMTGTQEMDTAEISDTSTPGLIPYRGNNPSAQVISACCSALAHYINVETA